MRNKKTIILEYLITFLACALLAFVIVAIRGIFTVGDNKAIIQYLVDAFFAVGVICLGFGLLVAVTNWGAFEIIVYGFMRFISLFKKDPTDVKYPTFYDYHVARAEKEKMSFLYFILVGSFYVIVSLILLYVWYQQ